jgi:16S rRNA G527 N7-methylase RsmG
VPPLAAYLACLDVWAARTNLTGARTARDRVTLLVAGIAPLAPHLLNGSVLDIGSGNGSPGLVLAALRPELPVVLLEPRQRRWAFLRDAARAMGRPDVGVLRQRHDEYSGPAVLNLVVRAVALPLSELWPLTAPGGQVIQIGRVPDPTGTAFESPEALGGGAVRYRRRST